MWLHEMDDQLLLRVAVVRFDCRLDHVSGVDCFEVLIPPV